VRRDVVDLELVFFVRYLAEGSEKVELRHDGEGLEPETVAPDQFEGLPAGMDDEGQNGREREEVLEMAEVILFRGIGLRSEGQDLQCNRVSSSGSDTRYRWCPR
jgi:hypothetical protein